MIYSGISSLAFTRYGEALYLHSSSELQRISVSASNVTQVDCSLNVCIRDIILKSLLRSATPVNGYTDDEQEDSPKVNGMCVLMKCNNRSVIIQLNNFHIAGLTNGTQENGDTTSQLNNSNDLSVGDITIDSIKDHLGR